MLFSNKLCFELLLNAGADLYTTTKDGDTVLMMACEKGEVTMVKSILHSLRCNVDQVPGDDRSRKLQYLEQYINKTNKNGTTALLKTCYLQAHKAACDITLLLISYGADSNICDNIQKSSAVHIVAMHDNANLLIILSKQGVNMNTQDKDGVTPLFIAVEYGSIKVVCELGNILFLDVERNDLCDHDRVDIARKIDKMNPLLIAAERGRSFVEELLCSWVIL